MYEITTFCQCFAACFRHGSDKTISSLILKLFVIVVTSLQYHHFEYSGTDYSNQSGAVTADFPKSSRTKLRPRSDEKVTLYSYYFYGVMCHCIYADKSNEKGHWLVT